MSPDVELVRSVRFEPGRHDAAGFDSGVVSLDSWLTRHAVVAARMRTAATYVWVEQGRVRAYYAVAPHAVARAELPTRVASNAPSSVPAYLIGKLAVCREWQGSGRGSALLLDALARLAAAIQKVPARLVVVDAIDESAQRFYEAHGFRQLPGRPFTLFLSSADLVATISAVG